MTIIQKKFVISSWESLKRAAEDGVLSEIINEGDFIPVTLRTGEKIMFRATHDDTGKLFFVMENCLEDEHYMNREDTTAGGWAACDMRRYINKTIFALLPDDLQAVIAPTRIVQIVNGERVETDDKLFLLSRTQVFGEGPWTEREPEDTQLACFRYERNRVKECGDHGTWFWWLRSAYGNDYFNYVYSTGGYNYHIASNSYGVALGFCLTR